VDNYNLAQYSSTGVSFFKPSVPQNMQGSYVRFKGSSFSQGKWFLASVR